MSLLSSALIKCTQSMTISTVCKYVSRRGSTDRLLGKQLLRIWFGNEREPCRNRGLYPNRLPTQPEQIVKYGELTLRENQIAYAEPSFFRLFDFELLKGDKKTCLSMPGQVVIPNALPVNISRTKTLSGRYSSLPAHTTRYRVK